MLQHLALGPDTVDVSMETLASLWARDPADLGGKRHEPSSAWESGCVFNGSAPAAVMWTEQLSPQLQRNKQLQDTLLQREEELARLQEENNKLREFLSSSFVRNLEQKAKKLTAGGRRKLKRNLTNLDNEPFQTCGHQLVSSQQVSKRICRNLTAEFSSETSEAAACSQPNLELWVLRTLGLKDRDTIDTSNDSSSEYSLGGLVYDAAVTPSSSPECTVNSSFSPPVTTCTPPSVHSYCQRLTRETAYSYSAAECQEANSYNPAKLAQKCTGSAGDFTAAGLPGHYEAPEAVTSSYNTSTAFQSDRADIITALSHVQTLEGNPAGYPAYWSPLPDNQTPSQDTNQFSPRAETVYFPPLLSSSPVLNQPSGCSPTSPSAASQPPATPQTPRSRTDLAFSMSLSPSSSVKTHSFPQGQAFVRKDTEGRWNFTWVPRQGP